MLNELYTNEFVLYTQHLRPPKDDYAIRKAQKDVRKLEKWLHALLDETEVVIFYIDKEDNNIEKTIIATRIPPVEGYVLPESPLEEEVVNGVTKMVPNHCCFFTMPSRRPMTIHFNDITGFLLKNDKVSEISKKISVV